MTDLENTLKEYLEKNATALSSSDIEYCIERMLTFKNVYPVYDNTVSPEEYEIDRIQDFNGVMTYFLGAFYKEVNDKSVQSLIENLYLLIYYPEQAMNASKSKVYEEYQELEKKFLELAANSEYPHLLDGLMRKITLSYLNKHFNESQLEQIAKINDSQDIEDLFFSIGSTIHEYSLEEAVKTLQEEYPACLEIE